MKILCMSSIQDNSNVVYNKHECDMDFLHIYCKLFYMPNLYILLFLIACHALLDIYGCLTLSFEKI